MKKLLFSLAFFMGAMIFGSVSLYAGEEIMRWQQLSCTDGSGGVYEICFYSGDGNQCYTYLEKTRNCDPNTDPPTIG